MLKDMGVPVKCLHQDDKRMLFLLYDQDKMMKYLLQPGQRKLLEASGYRQLEADAVLDRLAKRLSAYRKGCGKFPHEIGIFLGYPICDVVEFIKNKGKNSLYTGYWKVYNNLAEAKAIFSEYDRAKEMAVSLCLNGKTLEEIRAVSGSVFYAVAG